MTLVAFGDESGGHTTADPGIFILSASIFRDSDVDAARAAMAGLKPKGSVKLHWRESHNHKRRSAIVTVVAALRCQHHHVVIRTAAHEKPERMRAKAMEHLLIELDKQSVSQVTFESRTPKQDIRDRDVLRTLDSLGRLTVLGRLDHAQGKDEPMVWIPDVICGVVADSRIHESPEFRDQLNPTLTEHLI
jgi:hypothetical protein